MKVSELLEQRRRNWLELESLCSQMQNRRKKKMPADSIVRFSSLYRAACADLALADAYQLPPNTVQYLHQLVGQAHNQLYRSRKYQFSRWAEVLLVETPQKILNDPCVQFVFVVFWGLFILSAWFAYNETVWPQFGKQVLGEDQIEAMKNSFHNFEDFSWSTNVFRASFYIWNNAGIGLQCFAGSVVVIPGVALIAQNAVILGASFGVMFQPEAGQAGVNFRNFVTAHGPFELGAIVLAGAAGLRIGVSWLFTRGLTRLSSLRGSLWDAMPIACCATVLFILAAFIEAFISPSTLPWEIKAFIALFASTLMTFYFVVLGYPRN